ncbi:hypothetical protein [Streptomyces sp. NPDC048639]|uniref:hypothetical protein n=1 Tax=Streptomyces sp. NPDC048639 TaxID=3365581 RepID=UPI00371274BD
MVEVEELLDGVPVRLAPAEAVRARGERRRARRRLAGAAVAVVAAAAVGIGSWTQLADDSRRPAEDSRDTPVVAAGPNPFVKDGVVQGMKPSQLPMNATMHWKVAEEEGRDGRTLPQVGLYEVCKWRGGVSDPAEFYFQQFDGKDKAKARYRVSRYPNVKAAGEVMRALRETLSDCGLTKVDDGRYQGRAGHNGPWLELTVRQWKAWIGVVETQYTT